jgi:Predicted DNA alkylation repair enzyme
MKNGFELEVFKKESWSQGDYARLMDFLMRNCDEEYRVFNERTIPGSEGKTLGVRMSVLRPLSKKIASGNWREFLELKRDEVHEEVMLEGMVISEAKMEYKDRLKWIERFVPKITNWGLCDSFVNGKMLKGHEAEFWSELDGYLSTENPWAWRFAFLVMMTYYLNSEHIDDVLKRVLRWRSEFYYVQMMQAWLLATAWVKQRGKTLEFLEEHAGSLSPEVVKMTIRKIRDSYRVSNDDKELVLRLRNSSS